MAEKSSVWHKIVSLFKTRSQFVLIPRYREQVAEANKRDYFLLLLTALVLNSAILVSRIWIPGRENSVAKWILSGSQLGLTLLALCLYPPFKNRIPAKHYLWIGYLFVAINFVTTILSGTYYLSPDRESFSFLLVSIVYPIFLVDVPWRKFLFLFVFATAFSFCDFYGMGLPGDRTYYSIFVIDMAHQLEFLSASYILQYLMAYLNILGIESFERTKQVARIHQVSALLNRTALLEDTPSYLNRPVAVLMFDIDHFKSFNDIYGHPLGDKVLEQMGEKLKSYFGENHAYSYGGDEFLIATPELKSEEEIKERLNALFNDGIEFQDGEHKVDITFSCGYVYGIAKDPASFEKMNSQADSYLYEAKDKGRNGYAGAPYDPDKKRTGVLNTFTHPTDKALVDPVTKLLTPIYFREKVAEMLHTSFEEEKKPLIVFYSLSDYADYIDENGKEKGEALLKNVASSLEAVYPNALLCHSSGSHFYAFIEEKAFLKTVNPLIDEVELLTKEKQTFRVGVYYLKKDSPIDVACSKARLSSILGRSYLKEIGQGKPKEEKIS